MHQLRHSGRHSTCSSHLRADACMDSTNAFGGSLGWSFAWEAKGGIENAREERYMEPRHTICNKANMTKTCAKILGQGFPNRRVGDTANDQTSKANAADDLERPKDDVT